MDDLEKQITDLDENLHKWFKEKWVRFGPDGKIRGKCAREKSSEGKPKCRPLKSAQAMGKKARATAASRKRREDPNPDRSGKAHNVKTEEVVADNITENHECPICGGELVSEVLMNEKKDACYYKVKSRYKVWPSAYASGALVKCRKKGAKNWGTKSEGFEEVDEACWKGYHKDGMKTMFGKKYPNCVKNESEQQSESEELDEKWSNKYKRSIDCSHPKGFSQKAHCQGRKKTEESIMKKDELKNLIKEIVAEVINEKEDFGDQLTRELRNAIKTKNAEKAVYYKQALSSPTVALAGFDKQFKGSWAYDQWLKKNADAIAAQEQEFKRFAYMGETANDGEMEEVWNEQSQMQDECWECYEAAMQEGMDEAWEECYRKTNWDMVPEGDEHTCEGDEFYECYGDMNADLAENLTEAEYRGRKVKLGKPMRGDVKKFKVFVRNPKTGKVKKVNFGDPNMRIKKSNPKRRKSFRARHHCDTNPGPRTKARYWSCRAW